MLSRFHLIPERHGQTDSRTDRFAISISRASMLTRDKNRSNRHLTQSRLQVMGCTAERYCLLHVVVYRARKFPPFSNGQLFSTTYGSGATERQSCPIFEFWPIFPIQNPKTYLPVTSLCLQPIGRPLQGLSGAVQ